MQVRSERRLGQAPFRFVLGTGNRSGGGLSGKGVCLPTAEGPAKSRSTSLFPQLAMCSVSVPMNQLPVRAASNLSLVNISKGRSNRTYLVDGNHRPIRSPFGAPDYIAATDSPHHTPLLERLEKCIGLGVAPCQFGSGTFF